MDPLVLEILASLTRAGLALLTGYLQAHHVITADLGDRLTTHVVEHVAIWAPAIAAVVWGIVAKYRGRVKFLTALQLPAGSSERNVEWHIETGQGASVKTGS